jgi:phage shock protein A
VNLGDTMEIEIGYNKCVIVSKSDVKIGRLERKIEKLKQQRDYYKNHFEHYKHVISMQPYLERRLTSYEENKKELERIKGLEARVKEQEKLIKLLSEKTN